LLRKIFGRKREKVAGTRRKLNNEAIHKLHPETSIIRVRWAGHAASMGGHEK
jgi:hypothetical protein